jgi:hypothetical protein
MNAPDFQGEPMKKKPISAHKVQGTYRADRHAQRSLQFASGAVCPKFLSNGSKGRMATCCTHAGTGWAIAGI